MNTLTHTQSKKGRGVCLCIGFVVEENKMIGLKFELFLQVKHFLFIYFALTLVSSDLFHDFDVKPLLLCPHYNNIIVIFLQKGFGSRLFYILQWCKCILKHHTLYE